MKHTDRRIRRRRRLIEACIVVAVAFALFGWARAAGVAARGNTLWGGEIVVPIGVPFLYYATKSIVRDIKGGLFK